MVKKLSRFIDRLPAWAFKILINLWPPFLGAGIKVKTISPDFRYVEVMMKLKRYNSNYVGTHFGGSIFSMADPFYMLILLKNLGNRYIVWDKAASIDFIKAGKGTLFAKFRFSEAEIKELQEKVEKHNKYILNKSVNIYDKNGEVIAAINKVLYIRRK